MPLGIAQAQPIAGKEPVAIGTRLELFIDDFLIDRMTGAAERRLHHPVPREVVHTLEKPWEGDTSAYLSVVQDGERVLIYYNATPRPRAQTTGLIESRDGIRFSRPNIGLHDFQGSTENNLLPIRPLFGAAGHNFTPFKDPNPAAPPDQRFKAIAYYPRGAGLGAYVSPDGIHWKMLVEDPIITRDRPDGTRQGAFDSQNVAFWDPVRELYVCYYRGPDPRGISRGIWRSTSTDFATWTEPHPIEYADDRRDHLYTNGIRPYFRAPHLYIGLPNRFVPGRRKIPEHPNSGINDVVLMSSRNGVRFQRWPQAFLRPGPEPEVWTDRNLYPAWGMVQLSPEETTLYWIEHYRHATMRFRRGTIRTDGFVSLHAGGEAGGMLTRPLIFAGDRLVVNYATSAIGSLQFELADAQGRPIEGFTLAESEALFGNEIERTVTWKNNSNLRSLKGRPVRLRVQLHDADLYSIRFAP